MALQLTNEKVFVGKLTTVGRKTGEPRTVELRLVYYDGKFYTTSSDIETKHWCRNLLQNPAVEGHAGNGHYPCRARRVDDVRLRKRILELRDSPALSDRIVFELAPEKPVKG